MSSYWNGGFGNSAEVKSVPRLGRGSCVGRLPCSMGSELSNIRLLTNLTVRSCRSDCLIESTNDVFSLALLFILFGLSCISFIH